VPEDGLAQIELEFVAQIGAPEHLRAPAATRGTEDVTKHVPEDVAESVRGIGSAPAARTRGGIDPRMAILVVSGALGRLGEHFIGFLRLLEALLGLRVARIAVRVIFHRQAPVRLLDFRLGRRLRDVENLVVIALGHAGMLA